MYWAITTAIPPFAVLVPPDKPSKDPPTLTLSASPLIVVPVTRPELVIATASPPPLTKPGMPNEDEPPIFDTPVVRVTPPGVSEPTLSNACKGAEFIGSETKMVTEPASTTVVVARPSTGSAIAEEAGTLNASKTANPVNVARFITILI